MPTKQTYLVFQHILAYSWLYFNSLTLDVIVQY